MPEPPTPLTSTMTVLWSSEPRLQGSGGRPWRLCREMRRFSSEKKRTNLEGDGPSTSSGGKYASRSPNDSDASWGESALKEEAASLASSCCTWKVSAAFATMVGLIRHQESFAWRLHTSFNSSAFKRLR